MGWGEMHTDSQFLIAAFWGMGDGNGNEMGMGIWMEWE